MVGQGVGTVETVSNNEALDRLRLCREALERGFEASNSADQKHAFMQAIRAVGREIEAILAADISIRTKDYKALTDDIKRINKQLEELKKQIEKLITSLETVSKFVSAIDGVIKMAAPFFI